MDDQRVGTGRAHSTRWHVLANSFWLSSSYKWFLMLIILPLKVREILGQPPDASATWGLVVMIGSVEAMIGPALCGYVSDRLYGRVSRNAWIIAGALLTAAAMLAFQNATTIPMLIASYLLLQIADDVATGPYQAMIPDLVPTEERGFASGVRGLLDQGARVLGAAAIFVIPGANALTWSIAALNIVCAVAVWLTTRNTPRLPVLEKSNVGDGFLKPWLNADFRRLWFSQFLNNLGFYLIFFSAAEFLIQRIGIEPDRVSTQYGMIAVALSLTGAIAAVVTGRKADQIGRKRVMLAAGIWLFVALLPLAYLTQIWQVILLATVIGIGFGPSSTMIWAMAGDVIGGSAESAKDMGLWQSSVVVPQFFTGAFMVLLQWLNERGPGLGFQVLYACSPVFFLLAALSLQRVRSTH